MTDLFEAGATRLRTKRKKAERRFKACGLAAILIACSFLLFLLMSITSQGINGFLETRVTLPIYFDPAIVDPEGNQSESSFSKASYSPLVLQALKNKFPEIAVSRTMRVKMLALFSKNAGHELKNALKENPKLLGQTKEFDLLASSDADRWMKDRGYESGESLNMPKLGADQHRWLTELWRSEKITLGFSLTFFTASDSREPEQAGILGSVIGSLFTLLVCLLCALPLGIASAIYLEEYAPKNRLTDLIEININNLAAIPSIIFGLLGLSIYLHFFGMPRSSALVGGLTLALLVLPTIVITTRNALKAVPPSIRHAALSLGASPMQVILHHTLPLALPGIMTGTILSIARALGETAPLLMIGMVAFVADIPSSMFDPSTAMPVQIFLWADSPEAGFIEKTSACIMVLLVFLIFCNMIAAALRKRSERTW